ncbi:hypothetical protein [Leucobacter sp. wl10]|uniref:hypothetical protein n=1 Tax=Leucobacter sp. wl10 TaxID=2304677 RepID=UPI000E5BB327|nr:hypothetical protein [Leucobacter sp. wl10]RGE19800.1 hypothetical protein D1J51_10545 [Leucobacter sp. wl10]
MIMIDIDSLGPVLMMLTAIATIGAFVLGSHRSLSRQFDTKIEALDTKVEARFEAVDARFSAVDARFDGIDHRFEEVDRRFESMDRRFDAMDRRFASMDHRLDALETRLGEHEATTAEGFHKTHLAVSKLEERFDLWERILLPLIAAVPKPGGPPQPIAK